MERRNNFDAIRLIASFLVVISHAFPISRGNDAVQPLWELSGHQITLGRFAVVIFFIVSGYLVTASAQHRSLAAFLVARAVRILPALAVLLFVLAFIAGSMLSTLPATRYFTSPKPYEYFFVNLSLLRYTDGLPGVFVANPSPDVVDGSLWSLCYEARCYLLVALIGALGLLNRWVVLLLFVTALILSSSGIGGMNVTLATYFLAGAAIRLWALPMRSWIAGSCAIVWVCSLWFGFHTASATAGAYLIIYVALAKPIRFLNPAFGDLSYGVYIWAFPIQQAIATTAVGSACWYANVVLSLPLTIVAAVISWHLIERPALRLKSEDGSAFHFGSGDGTVAASFEVAQWPTNQSPL